MKAWTDYPLCKDSVISGRVLDEPGTKVPIREVEVVGWDGNKYARVQYAGGIYSFKVGYLYTRPGRCGTVSPIKLDKVPILSGDDLYK